MKFGIKSSLASIALVGVVLSGCGHFIPQKVADNLGEFYLGEWMKTTDNYLEIHRLTKKGEYEKAQTQLEFYLKQGSRDALQIKDFLNGTDKLSKSTFEIISKTIDAQVKKIDSSLR